MFPGKALASSVVYVYICSPFFPASLSSFPLARYPEVTLSDVVLVVKNPPANAEDTRDSGSVPGLGRSPGEGHGNPLQYSCLENPMDRGAWVYYKCEDDDVR